MCIRHKNNNNKDGRNLISSLLGRARDGRGGEEKETSTGTRAMLRNRVIEGPLHSWTKPK